MAGLYELGQIAAINILENIEEEADIVRNFYRNVDPFVEMSERKFKSIFRMPKRVVEDIIESVSPYMNPQTRTSSLDVRRKVLTALKFFATGSYQQDVALNLCSAMSQPSVSRCIKEVVDALNVPNIFNRYVKFPQNIRELKNIRSKFYDKYGFPGVVGCLDCTHVAIHPPKIEDPLYPERIYVNRKGYHSINVQLICDSDLKITNVNAKYPGSTHDCYIWNNSNISQTLENLHNIGYTSFFLLGDSGYPLRSWLMTPILNAAQGSPEEAYNDCQKSTRSVIERCNGILKTRFRCLLKHRTLHYQPETASKIINACIVLHNICIENNVPLYDNQLHPDFDYGILENEANYEEININEVNINPQLAAGRRARRNIVINHFTA